MPAAASSAHAAGVEAAAPAAAARFGSQGCLTTERAGHRHPPRRRRLAPLRLAEGGRGAARRDARRGGWRALAWCDERLAVGKAADASAAVSRSRRRFGRPSAAAGVIAGAWAAAHDLCVLLPVDCPLVTPAALRGWPTRRATPAPASGPLPGAYRRRLLADLERRLAAGALALRDALAAADTATVAVDPTCS